VPAPKVPEWEQIANRIWERAEEVIAGRQGLDEGLAGLDQDADRILEKRRWLLARGSHGGASRGAANEPGTKAREGRTGLAAGSRGSGGGP
jgi:hypothetical protein